MNAKRAIAAVFMVTAVIFGSVTLQAPVASAAPGGGMTTQPAPATGGSACYPAASPQKQKQLAALTDPAQIKTYADAARTIKNIRAEFTKPNDYRGTFPIAFDNIVDLVGPSIQAGIYEDPVWATNLTIEVVRLYVTGLHEFLIGGTPTYNWAAALALTKDCSRSPGRVLMGQIFSHLLVDFAYALVTVNSTPARTKDFYTFGTALVNATPAIVSDFKNTYGEDLSGLFTAWFVGDLIGDSQATTLLFQSTRTVGWVDNFGLQNPLTHDATEAEMRVAFAASNVALDTMEKLNLI